jgi:DNA-binding PadR family transcriptional regulator
MTAAPKLLFSPTEQRIAAVLMKQGIADVASIRLLADVARGTVYQTLARMVERGFLRVRMRRKDLADRMVYRLTPGGEQLYYATLEACTALAPTTKKTR